MLFINDTLMNESHEMFESKKSDAYEEKIATSVNDNYKQYFAQRANNVTYSDVSIYARDKDGTAITDKALAYVEVKMKYTDNLLNDRFEYNMKGDGKWSPSNENADVELLGFKEALTQLNDNGVANQFITELMEFTCSVINELRYKQNKSNAEVELLKQLKKMYSEEIADDDEREVNIDDIQKNFRLASTQARMLEKGVPFEILFRFGKECNKKNKYLFKKDYNDILPILKDHYLKGKAEAAPYLQVQDSLYQFAENIDPLNWKLPVLNKVAGSFGIRYSLRETEDGKPLEHPWYEIKPELKAKNEESFTPKSEYSLNTDSEGKHLPGTKVGPSIKQIVQDAPDVKHKPIKNPATATSRATKSTSTRASKIKSKSTTTTNDSWLRELDSRLAILEGKLDQQNLRDFLGDIYYDKYQKIKSKVSDPMYKDIYQLLKKDADEVKDYIDSFKSTAQTQRQNKSKGAELIAQNELWKVYKVTTYQAAKLYGKNTRWCISGNYDGHEEEGESYFNDYISSSRVNDFFIFIISKTKADEKYCLITNRSDNSIHQVFNAADDQIFKGELPKTIPEIPGFESVNDLRLIDHNQARSLLREQNAGAVIYALEHDLLYIDSDEAEDLMEFVSKLSHRNKLTYDEVEQLLNLLSEY